MEIKCFKCKLEKPLDDYKIEKIYKSCKDCREKGNEKKKKKSISVKELYEYLKGKYEINETLKDVIEELKGDEVDNE